MPAMTVNVEVWCATCGAGLCNKSVFIGEGQRRSGLHVEACQRCIDTAYAEGQADAEVAAEAKLADAEKETQRVVAENEYLEEQLRRANKRVEDAEQTLANADLEADLATPEAA